MWSRGDGGMNPALRDVGLGVGLVGYKPTLQVFEPTEGSARPRGGAWMIVVATLSRRGSRQINRRTNGEIAPAHGGGRARPGGASHLDSGLGNFQRMNEGLCPSRSPGYFRQEDGGVRHG